METNIGHLYYKQYFNGLELNRNTGKPKLEAPINQKLFNLRLSNYAGLIVTPYKETPVSLTTIYPGLLIGSGYIHEVGGKEIESELKLGFFFDHTTGLPVIPGSSVKGLLRSAFKKVNGDYIKELLASLNIKYTKEISVLEKAIFENSDPVSVYKRDVFFDAYPVNSGNTNTTFLANDYITHHEDPLKSPNPVQFLKILPNVQFQFNFKLTGNGGLSAEDKRNLFKQILLDLGIGAKTNVGYGQFTNKAPVDNTSSGKNTGEGRGKGTDHHPTINTPDPVIEKFSKISKIADEYTVGEQYKTIIIKEVDAHFIFQIGDDTFVKSIVNIEKKFNKDAAKRISKGKSGNYKTLEVEDKVFIRINNIEEKNFTVMPIWTD